MLKKLSSTLLLTIHFAIALGLLLTGYSYVLSPVKWGVAALAGYGLPAMLVLTAGSILLALCTKKRHLAVPVVALLLAYKPVTMYVPVSHTTEVPEGALKVMTYNTHSWGAGEGKGVNGDSASREVMTYIAEQAADIVTLQEGVVSSHQHNFDSLLKPLYPHVEAVELKAGVKLQLLSRYPVKRSEVVADGGNGNGAAAYWLDVNGREMIVVNCHLLTTGLSLEQREQFEAMVKGEKEGGRREVSKSIVSQLLESTRRRVPQADSVATFVRRHTVVDKQGVPLLVMGDFNDIPNSYVHSLLDRHLTDCYAATGLGPGWSFSKYGMRVRIDHALCSDELTPYNFKVDSSFGGSDHYALIGWVGL